jgi:hypothetical protein
MLFKILKVFGLDVPAQIEAAKSSLERRVERATGQIKQVAEEAAVVAALSALAIVTFAMAVAVGLIALYRWTADTYGEYVGFGVVDGILVVAAALLIAAVAIRAGSLRSVGMKLRPAGGTAAVLSVAGPTPIAEAARTEPYCPEYTWTPPTTAAYPVASGRDLVESLAYILGKYVKFPTIGNPVLDEVIGNLHVAAKGSTDEAIDRAANVIRHGDRSNIVLVLTGTAFLAWLLTHNSRQ